jgi:hypothetical protein
MKNRSTGREMVMASVAAVVAAAALGGCQTARQGVLAAKDCRSPGQCQVAVDANSCSPIAADPVYVYRDRNKPTIIRWDAPTGYIFTGEGIKFDPSAIVDPHPGIQNGGEKWMVVIKPRDQRESAKYRIQLKSTSLTGTICTGPDPVIITD